jgi:colicin import membrane protein
VLPGAVPASRRPAAQPVGEAREPTDLQAAQRAREERERRERAERRVAEARARLEAVASELTDRTAAAKSAARKHAELQQLVRDLRQRLETVEREAEASMADVEAANRARERAEAERDRAREAFEEAQSELKR